jgi:hypothetical protein
MGHALQRLETWLNAAKTKHNQMVKLNEQGGVAEFPAHLQLSNATNALNDLAEAAGQATPLMPLDIHLLLNR